MDITEIKHDQVILHVLYHQPSWSFQHIGKPGSGIELAHISSLETSEPKAKQGDLNGLSNYRDAAEFGSGK